MRMKVHTYKLGSCTSQSMSSMKGSVIALEKKKSAEVGYGNQTKISNTHKYINTCKVNHT